MGGAPPAGGPNPQMISQVLQRCIQEVSSVWFGYADQLATHPGLLP
jgi:hypothetical protein